MAKNDYGKMGTIKINSKIQISSVHRKNYCGVDDLKLKTVSQLHKLNWLTLLHIKPTCTLAWGLGHQTQ